MGAFQPRVCGFRRVPGHTKGPRLRVPVSGRRTPGRARVADLTVLADCLVTR